MNIRSTTLLVLISAMLSTAQALARPLKIVTTTGDLKSITESIAGDRATVSAICEGSRDAHYLQARPSFIMTARDADLWIRVGMELEIGWEPMILEGARNPDIRAGGPRHLDASEKVLKLDHGDKAALFLLGITYESAGRNREALRLFEKLSYLPPVRSDVFYHLGLLYGREKQLALAHKRLGQPQKAQFHFKKAKELAGGDPALQKKIHKEMEDSGREKT